VSLRARNFYANHRRKPFVKVRAAQAAFNVFEKVLVFRVLVRGPRHGGFKSAQVRSPFDCIDVVRERKDVLTVAVVILESRFDFDLVFRVVDVKDLFVEGVLAAIEVLDEFRDPALIKKNVLLENFEKGSGMRAMDNNTFLIDMQTTEHSGVYFVNPAATSDLSTGAPRYDQATVTAKAGFGSHSITDFALTAAKGKPGAIVNLATSFGDAVQAQLRRSMNRQFVGLGGTATGNAKIADVNGGSSGTTVTVDGYGTRFIMPGALVSIGTTAEHAAGSVNFIHSALHASERINAVVCPGPGEGTNVADLDRLLGAGRLRRSGRA